MSDLDTEIGIMLDEMDTFNRKILDAMIVRYTHIDESEDAGTLNGLTLAQVKAILIDLVHQHINTKNVNVHNVTHEELNVYNTEISDDKLIRLLDSDNDVPISYYSGSSITVSNWIVRFNDDATVIIGKDTGTVSSFNMLFDKEDDRWAEFNIWVVHENGSYRYEKYRDKDYTPENGIFIGYIRTIGVRGKIEMVDIRESISIGGYRLSSVSSDKSIPVSDGPSNEPRTLKWV